MTTYNSVFGNDTIPPTQSSYSNLVLTANTVLYWPELAQADTIASDIMDVSAASPYSLALPGANQVSVGRSLLINNIGSADITVTDSVGSTLAVILAGQVKNIYLTDNASVAGVWRVYTFGTGTSSADASALAGYGLSVVNGDLAQDTEIRITGGGATVSVSDRAGTYIFRSSGMETCSLPASTQATSGFFINIVNQGTGAITIDPDSGETIDGLFTKDLAPGESATLVCDGMNWVTVGYGRSTQFQFTKLVMDITTGSPFTLTSTQAENKLLQFIGTPTAAVTVNLPAVVAIYYVECAYAGLFLTKLQTATGTGVFVGGTDRVIVYCDGVNVVFAQTTGLPASSLAAGTAGSVVYQAAIDVTEFTEVGVTGDLLRSAGSSAPYFQAPEEFLVTKTSPTGSAIIPSGTTAQRDLTPLAGYDRFNSTIGKIDVFNLSG